MSSSASGGKRLHAKGQGAPCWFFDSAIRSATVGSRCVACEAGKKCEHAERRPGKARWWTAQRKEVAGDIQSAHRSASTGLRRTELRDWVLGRVGISANAEPLYLPEGVHLSEPR